MCLSIYRSILKVAHAPACVAEGRVHLKSLGPARCHPVAYRVCSYRVGWGGGGARSIPVIACMSRPMVRLAGHMMADVQQEEGCGTLFISIQQSH